MMLSRLDKMSHDLAKALALGKPAVGGLEDEAKISEMMKKWESELQTAIDELKVAVNGGVPKLSVGVEMFGRYIVSGSYDKSIGVWDVQAKTLFNRFQDTHSLRVASAAVTGDRRYIVSGSGDKSTAVWDV